jgi:hypothetical protein
LTISSETGVRIDATCVRDLSDGFAVSAQAMGNRLTNLGILSQQ